MPLACGGAAGVPKPGAPRFIAVTSAAIDGFVSAVVGAATNPYAGAALNGVLAGKTYDANTICAAPDPGDPGLSVTDFINAAQAGGQPIVDTAIAKLEQWFIHMLWPNLCSCADLTDPPASTSAPLPVIGTNPGMPSGVMRANCWDVSSVQGQDAHQSTWYTQLSPSTGTPFPGAWGQSSGPRPTSLPQPAPSFVQFDFTLHGNPVTDKYTAQLNAWDINGNLLPNQGLALTTTPCEVVSTFAEALPSNTGFIQLGVFHTTGTDITLKSSGRLQYFCGSNNTSTILTPCCPPDLSLDLRLRRIEDLEHIIINLMGQSGLGHTDGTAHTGLTGAGSITLHDSVTAIRVNVTSSLATWPNNPGDPNYYLSLGFITSIAAGSPLKGWRLVYSQQIFPIVAYADQIGYTLPPGVTATITELLPHP